LVCHLSLEICHSFMKDEDNQQKSLDSIQGKYIYTPRDGGNGDSETTIPQFPQHIESPVKETGDTSSDIQVIPPIPVVSPQIPDSRSSLDTTDVSREESNYYINQLALERNQRNQGLAQASILSDIGRSVGSPSLIKYLLILLLFALPNDIIDAIDFTAVLMPLSWFISMFLSVSTIFFTWFSDSELKRVQGHIEKIETHKKTLTKTATKISSRLTKFAPKNPVIKVIAGGVLEMLPFVNMLPWSCICVYLAYRDERNTFKETQRELDSTYAQISETSPEMV